jgi:hypothetical protein
VLLTIAAHDSYILSAGAVHHAHIFLHLRLRVLLTAAARFFIFFFAAGVVQGFLSNHMVHGLFSLGVLGATEPQLLQFYSHCKCAYRLTPPPFLLPNWVAHVQL